MMFNYTYMKGKFVTLATAFVFVIFLYWKFRLGLVRFFDVDEMAYLHWAHNVVSGRVPFVDFLSYVPPGFLYVLAPLFWIFQEASILTAGRVFAWVVFVGMCGVLGAVFVSIRGNMVDKGGKGNWEEKLWYFVLPGLFLSFLPMPADKLLEVRPDNLAVLISLFGLLFHVRKRNFWAGFFYSVSLLILPKTLPQVLVGTLWGALGSRGDKGSFFRLVLGLGVPIGIFGVWMMSTGNISLVWYSLTALPLEVNRIGEQFGMQPDLFFYPNDMYYGSGGWNIGLIANHTIWLIGIFVGAVRLVTGDFLVAGTFFAYIFVFMYGYPLRHPQYLIPIAAFIALFAADFLVTLKKKIGVIWVLGVIGGMFLVFQTVNEQKLSSATQEDARKLTQALSIIPKNSYVLDMVGSTIFYRDPYYVSAVPFGQWMPYLSRPLPSLSETLENTQTNYIYSGKTDRVDTLPERDKVYIYSKYTKSPDLDLFIRN